jgi:hypothetical protein
MRRDARTPVRSLDEEEIEQLLALAKRALWGTPELRRRLQAAKLNIVPSNFYSTIPSLDEIEKTFEQRYERAGPFHSPRVFDQQRMAAFLEELRPHTAGFAPPVEGDLDDPQGFFWENGAFTGLDAMAYWCMLRKFKPQRVVEIGSGFSTLVADAALRANGSGTQVLIEPYPKPWLERLPTVEAIHRRPVQSYEPRELVETVESGDLWFIDSTHTVKIGSDCLMIYLMTMPELRKPMLVHAHDIFLPFGFPPKKAAEKHIYWTEQYLLYAYLLDNPRAEVLFGSMYASRLLRQQAASLLPPEARPSGGSIWFRLAPP